MKYMYVVSMGDYAEDTIKLGVFSSVKRAREYIKGQRTNNIDTFHIERYALNEGLHINNGNYNYDEVKKHVPTYNLNKGVIL